MSICVKTTGCCWSRLGMWVRRRGERIRLLEICRTIVIVEMVLSQSQDHCTNIRKVTLPCTFHPKFPKVWNICEWFYFRTVNRTLPRSTLGGMGVERRGGPPQPRRSLGGVGDKKKSRGGCSGSYHRGGRSVNCRCICNRKGVPRLTVLHTCSPLDGIVIELNPSVSTLES